MHRRSQVSHTPTVTRRATAQGAEVGASHGASWRTGAGGRDDIREGSMFQRASCCGAQWMVDEDHAARRPAPARARGPQGGDASG